MPDEGSVHKTVVGIYEVVAGVFAALGIGAGTTHVAHRMRGANEAPQCPVNGRLDSITELSTSLKDFTEHMREFTTHVQQEHGHQLKIMETQGAALTKQGETLAVLCERGDRASDDLRQMMTNQIEILRYLNNS